MHFSQYDDAGRVTLLSLESTLGKGGPQVSASLRFAHAPGLPPAETAFATAAGHVRFAGGGHCEVAMEWLPVSGSGGGGGDGFGGGGDGFGGGGCGADGFGGSGSGGDGSEHPAGAESHPAAAHPARVHVTIADVCWRLTCGPAASGDPAESALLWPAAPAVTACHAQTVGCGDWRQVETPPHVLRLLSVLAAPLPPSVWQEPPHLPRDLRCPKPYTLNPIP